MTLGFRVNAKLTRVDAKLCARAAAVPVANIGDVVNRMQAMRGGFIAFGGRKTVAGPAFTVRARAGDNLMLHQSLDMAQPGDVIVCDAGGDLGTALMGDIMARYAAHRGIAAVIIDGAIRDVDGLAQIALGVWARSATPNGPYKDGPGEIGYPIACGGLAVMPGDLIAADLDGVLVIPREDAASAVEAAEAHSRKEHETIKSIGEDRMDRAWVKKLLDDKGVARQ